MPDDCYGNDWHRLESLASKHAGELGFLQKVPGLDGGDGDAGSDIELIMLTGRRCVGLDSPKPSKLAVSDQLRVVLEGDKLGEW